MRALLLVATGIVAGCPKVAPPTLQPDEVLVYRTSDGWEADLRHYPGEGPPVLLVHGMGANHYNWDYREEISLAHWLQQRGWDVWVPELRGDPGSRAPSRRALRSFTFDDHARLDLPAAVDAVLEVTGEDELFWVGHSMGGMLLYTALSQYPEKVAAGVAICSPATFEGDLAGYRQLRTVGWTLGGNGRIPSRALATLARPLGRANPLYAKLANRENLDWAVARGLARHALVDLPKPMARQGVQWMKSGELVDVEGEPWIAPADVPLLVLGAPLDKIVAESDVRAACALYPDCAYRLLGTEGGFSADYGHVDPVIGEQADDEIFPVIGAFLEEERDAVADEVEGAEGG